MRLLLAAVCAGVVVITTATSAVYAQAPRGLSPELGQHTEEVLLELGYEWERIAELKAAGAIP